MSAVADSVIPVRPLVVVTLPQGVGVIAVPLIGAEQAVDGSWWGTVAMPVWSLRSDDGRVAADIAEMPMVVPWSALTPVDGQDYSGLRGGL